MKAVGIVAEDYAEDRYLLETADFSKIPSGLATDFARIAVIALLLVNKACQLARRQPGAREMKTSTKGRTRMSLHFQRLIWTVSFSVISVLCTSATTIAADNEKKSDEYFELMKVFVDTFEQVDRNYVKDVDRRKLMEAAIRGMIAELDQYSNYISPEDLARFNQQVEQQFGGIGIQVQVDPKSKRLMVMSPLPGTPAYKAGIRAGDLIMEVEGNSTEGITLSQAVTLLKGKAGDAVKIGVKHSDSNKTEQVTLVRAIIQVATVLGDTYNADSSWNFMLDDKKKIGFIRLTHFSRRSADELAEALKTLTKQGMKALILDLRFNPGGLLSQATKISDLFIESGKIVSTQGRNSPDRVWTAKKEGTFSGFPIAILVNRYSASASEIVSACLQDHKRAIIVGERTWGKGSVQNVIELEGGHSALKLTTASYHRPSGKNIHRFPKSKDSDIWGVVPDKDYAVQFSTQDMRDYLDYRRQRDVLSKDGPPKSDFKDRQLDKALDYLVKALDGKTADKPDEKTTPEKTVPEKKDPKADPKADKKTDSKTDDKKDGKKTDSKDSEKKPSKPGKSSDGTSSSRLPIIRVPRSQAT